MWVLGAGGQGESLDVTEFGGWLPVSPGVNITLTTGEQLTQEEPSQAEQPRQRWQMSEWLVSKSVGVSFPSEPNSGLYCRDKKCLVLSVKVFNDFFIFIFRESGREGERETSMCGLVQTSRAPPTGDLACNTGLCPDWESNQ